MFKNLPAKAGDTSFIPDLGRIRMTAGQLSMCITATEPVRGD